MSKATATIPPRTLQVAKRTPVHQSVEPSGQWLVLIGDSGDDSDADDVLRFLREMCPDADGDMPH